MNKSLLFALTAKWLTILRDYEKIKAGDFSVFRTVNQLCEVHHVHRKDIRKYYERWIKSGKDLSALLPQNRGPKVGKYKLLTKEEERIIIKIRRKLGANEFEIFYMLKNKSSFNVNPSVSTIYRTFKKYPLNNKRKLKIKRYVKKYPGELLHADTYYLAKSIMQDRKRYYLFGIIDDCSRLAYVQVVTSINAAEVSKAFFHSLGFLLAHGIQPERVMTDNGAEFTAFTSLKAKRTHFFETMLNIVGIDHTYTRPYHPQSNGKIERFWRILHQECLIHLNFGQSLDTLSSEINSYLYRYNYQRRHSSLNYLTPLDRLLNVTELLK
jgi:transposase InsO family protein